MQNSADILNQLSDIVIDELSRDLEFDTMVMMAVVNSSNNIISLGDYTIVCTTSIDNRKEYCIKSSPAGEILVNDINLLQTALYAVKKLHQGGYLYQHDQTISDDQTYSRYQSEYNRLTAVIKQGGDSAIQQAKLCRCHDELIRLRGRISRQAPQ
jgi:hypothetical protein